MWDAVLDLYPQLRDAVEYFDVGTPLSNRHYLGSPQGELYGADHDLGRFTPAAVAALRPATPLPGLLLTGQDVFSCGFAGAMFGGLLAAATALRRNLFADLLAAKTAFGKPKPKVA